MNALESIMFSILFSVILNSLLRVLPQVFLHSASSECYALLGPENKCLFRKALVSDLEA